MKTKHNFEGGRLGTKLARLGFIYYMIPAVANLNVNEKLDLLWELWDSLRADEANIPVSEKDKKEVQRTLDEYRRTGKKGDTWNVVKARILASR